MDKAKITDGVYLRTKRTDKFVRATICYSFIMPCSRHIATGINIISAVFNHNVRSVYNRLEQMNGAEVAASVVKKGGCIMLVIGGECEPEFLSEVNRIIRDIIFDLSIDSINSMRAIDYCTDKLKLSLNDKRAFARERCIELMYEGDSFGVCGDGYEELFNTIDIYGFYDYMIKMAELEVFCIGRISDKVYNDLCDSLKINPREDVNEDRLKELKAIPNRINERDSVNQCRLCIAYSLDNNAFEIQMLANEILGGSAGSKLFNKVREDNSLCYYITGRLYRYRPLIIIEAGVEADRCDEVIGSVDRAIGEFKADREAVETAKGLIGCSYSLLKDSPSSLADFYLSQDLLGDKRGLDEFIQSVACVEPVGVSLAFNGCKRELIYTLGGLE